MTKRYAPSPRYDPPPGEVVVYTDTCPPGKYFEMKRQVKARVPGAKVLDGVNQIRLPEEQMSLLESVLRSIGMWLD